MVDKVLRRSTRRALCCLEGQRGVTGGIRVVFSSGAFHGSPAFLLKCCPVVGLSRYSRRGQELFGQVLIGLLTAEPVPVTDAPNLIHIHRLWIPDCDKKTVVSEVEVSIQ